MKPKDEEIGNSEEKTSQIKVSLSKLMKMKNRLAGRIAKTQEEIVSNSSYVEGFAVYDVLKLMEEHSAMIEQMIKLKIVLDESNRGGQQERIFRLGEKKNKMVMLKSLNTRSGSNTSYDGTVTVYVAVIGKLELDAMLRQLEREIDETQDSIDGFNASHKVTVDTELIAMVS